MKKPSLSIRRKQEASRAERSFRLGSIAMLPAGLLLLITSIVQLCRGHYYIGENFYGAATGPGLRAIMGFIFACLGAIFLWLTIRSKKKPNDNRPS